MTTRGLIALLIGLAFFMVFVGGLIFATTSNEVREAETAKVCIENGGNWILEQPDSEYSPKHSCVMP